MLSPDCLRSARSGRERATGAMTRPARAEREPASAAGLAARRAAEGAGEKACAEAARRATRAARCTTMTMRKQEANTRIIRGDAPHEQSCKERTTASFGVL